MKIIIKGVWCDMRFFKGYVVLWYILIEIIRSEIKKVVL